ncbi:hypothetical protein [uncultured Paracoccus sp.]|uniref:hypothetical protein n=1 Tax=uncultured Paracoccus sp. TaxID=189685 RepID=UPI0026363995|nr:hypothetical protein [uncultured Paracoccus sp.]
MARMATPTPARKVYASTIGAAMAVIIIYLIETFVTKGTLPEGVAAAITVVVTFLCGYYTPPSPVDEIVPSPKPI